MIGVLWALGLWYAAPAVRAGRRETRYGLADRLRDACVTGVALPLILGAFGALYPATLAVALLALVAVARRYGPSQAREPLPIVTIGTLALLAWPPLTRPPLEGDTLSYHLPNAASWVHAHGIWTTNTRYWWYPPASESFASGLYAFGSGAAVGLSGLAALALLGTRIATWARERCGCSATLADLLGAATVASLPIALQAGTLQNDVWQGAFFIETLWCARGESVRDGIAATALCALIKPSGWIFAGIALLAQRARPALWSAWAGAIALLVARAAVLAPSALVPLSVASQPHGLDSAIVAHGAGAIALAFGLLIRAAPLAGIALPVALAAPALAWRGDRALGFAALGAAVVFFLTPWGYADAHAQLATGASLRYADPAIAAGILVLAPALRRFPQASAIALALCVAYGCFQISATFWNDATSRLALPIALACVIAALSNARRRYVFAAVATACALVAAWHAGGRPVEYYADALAVGKTRPGVFAWIATARPARVALLGLPAGTVAVLSPASWFVDTVDGDECRMARTQRATLVSSSEAARPALDNSARRARALSCAPAIFRDASAVAVSP